MDAVDRAIINGLQGGFPICERPFAEAAAGLGLSEAELISRIKRLAAYKTISRFGPMWHAERLGGGLTLAAMKVPAERFDEVAATVNAFPEIAHNYARDHAFNMWFVVATERPERIAEVIAEIEAATGLAVHDMPKVEEFFVGLRFEA
ncbi:MAG: Lrp/AsnC family transcriptional regulator [Actinomycetota bacterium]